MKIDGYSFKLDSCYLEPVNKHKRYYQDIKDTSSCNRVECDETLFPTYSAPRRNWKGHIKIAAIKRVNLIHGGVQEFVN